MYRPRLALSLFDPEAGNWYINWNPISNLDPSPACHYGWWYDVPLGGLGSPSGTGPSFNKSGYAVYRSTEFDIGTTYFRDAQGVCGGGTHHVTDHAFAMPRSTVAVVRDMTGDAYPELLVADPDTLEVHVLTSESDYANSTYGLQTIPVFNIQTHLAVIL